MSIRRTRIQALRESIARRALDFIKTPSSARILDVQRVGDVLIVATEEPACRWARYHVNTFRFPAPDDTDPDFEDSNAPKLWACLAGWGGAGADELPDLLASATAYAVEVNGRVAS
ncbi:MULTISPECIES: hypothetical protein [Streptomyces]|uniref:Uncharacterized protein n=1 Tax=Streptomyces fradiae ATCC 10745 = DSM 40063 TaxID=1319510 RepID=A0A1Y2NT05_STRFR|nr:MULTISPECIES: hypothetical protein [Streptomyces]KAF0646735.1 hypothetical protein K701_27530 [Streptomyces fradiae ATCC 10745 = DSM 40063]OSY50624.1 hypothetical protein BG846_03792 [Streptomyces fradiae ATCC 10745 = DSM 40063]QEV11645.1 hypothetical protein CP974_06045 [Streptomyces fradiae ATCC 10745 = DSM 40063]